jgi:hypothetical protein
VSAAPSTPAIRPGMVVWRIGERTKLPLRCIVIRSREADVVVKASRFSRDERAVHVTNIFTDRDACRAEIQRRREQAEAAP